MPIASEMKCKIVNGAMMSKAIFDHFSLSDLKIQDGHSKMNRHLSQLSVPSFKFVGFEPATFGMAPNRSTMGNPTRTQAKFMVSDQELPWTTTNYHGQPWSYDHELPWSTIFC